MNENNGILNQVLNEELERLNRIESVYKNELSGLPKGKIMFKNIKGNKYPYLQYRLGSKVKSVYINDPIKLNEMELNIAKRKEIEQAIKRVNSDKKQLEKAVKVIRPKNERNPKSLRKGI